MIILPIGTRSSIAFRPKLTIALIALNIFIAVISFLSTDRDEAALFDLQKRRLSRQSYLYALEKLEKTPGPEIEMAVSGIDNAGDYYTLQESVIKVIYSCGGSVENFQDFEGKLKERDLEHYYQISVAAAANYEEWNQALKRERRIQAGNVNHAFGLIPSRMERYHTFITHLFLHGGLFHLLGNMLFLWVVGCLLEDSWGRIPFLAFYLAGGAFAGLAHCLQDTSSAIPLIGASGAIAAAMGAFTVIHFKTRIKFFYFFLFFFRPYLGTFLLPAFVFLPLWFLQQVALKSLADFAGGSNVAYVAHIAGYMMGVLTALALRITGFEERFLSSRVRRKQIKAGILKDPRFSRGHEYINKGIVSRGVQIFNELMSERPGDTQMIQDIAMIFKEKGLRKEFDSTAGKALKNLLVDSRNSEAAEWAAHMITEDGCPEASHKLLLRVGKWLEHEERYQEAFDIYGFVKNGASSTRVSVKSSMALARMLALKMNDRAQALSIMDEIKNSGLGPDWSQRIFELEALIEGSSGGVEEHGAEMRA